MTNTKLAKRSFLVSLVALILCFSMLMGTTFAWFTDSVTSENNIIKSGKLDVEMYWADELLDSTSDKWNDASKGAIFDYQYWEPGYSEVKYIKIVNAGDLAFKFQLNLIPDILPTVGKANLADVIDVYLLDPAAEVKADTPMTNKGTLASLMSATDGAAKGAILPASGANGMNLDAIKAALGVTDIPVGEIIVAIKLTMKETAGNEYQNLTVGDGFAVQLLATQVEAEIDSFDNSYDQGATYPSEAGTATELIDALRSGKSVTLTKNIDLKNVEWTPIASYSGVLDGNGYAIQNLTGENGLFNELSGATIKNLTLENVDIDATSNHTGALAGYIVKSAGQQTVIDGVTVTGTVNGGDYYVGGIIGADSNYDTVIKNCVNNATVVANGQQVGGIVGYATRGTLIENCTNNAAVTGGSFVGGILGFAAGDDEMPELSTTIKNCANAGVVTETNTTVTWAGGEGGIVGAIGRAAGDAATKMLSFYILDCTDSLGQKIYGKKHNVLGGHDNLLNVVIGTAIAEGVYEAGTRNYYVSDAAGLVNVKSIIPQNHEQAQSINLLCDIDMSGVVWTPMDNMHLTFNGNGHTISNLNCAEGWRSGLFGYAGGIVINDLTLENVTARGAQAGTFAGAAEGLRMNNCYLKGNNTVTYVTYKTDSYEETWGGIGAISGVISGTVINAEIVAGATVTVNKGTMKTECPYFDDLTGYLTANGGTVVNNGTLDAFGQVSVSNDVELLAAIAAHKQGKTIIVLNEGTYASDLVLTVEKLGNVNGSLILKAADNATATLAGTVTLGYRNQGMGAATWNVDVTFDGVTFDAAVDATHSLDVQDVKSLTLKDCTIIGDGEYGLTSARGNATGTSKIVGCTFQNAAMQILGNFGSGLVIDDCDFINSRVNVQAGNGVTVQYCDFNATLTDANVDDSFYLVRSNSTPITVKGCEIVVDSTVTGVAASQAKWGLLFNRGATNWTVEDVNVTLTDAALAQTELKVTSCTSTGVINATNLTVNGVAQ